MFQWVVDCPYLKPPCRERMTGPMSSWRRGPRVTMTPTAMAPSDVVVEAELLDDGDVPLAPHRGSCVELVAQRLVEAAHEDRSATPAGSQLVKSDAELHQRADDIAEPSRERTAKDDVGVTGHPVDVAIGEPVDGGPADRSRQGIVRRDL